MKLKQRKRRVSIVGQYWRSFTRALVQASEDMSERRALEIRMKTSYSVACEFREACRRSQRYLHALENGYEHDNYTLYKQWLADTQTIFDVVGPRATALMRARAAAASETQEREHYDHDESETAPCEQARS